MSPGYVADIKASGALYDKRGLVMMVVPATPSSTSTGAR